MLEKLIYKIIHFLSPLNFLAPFIQLILHLLLIRYLVIQLAFAGQCFLFTRSMLYNAGKSIAFLLSRQLEIISRCSQLFNNPNFLFKQSEKDLLSLQKDYNPALEHIGYYYQTFTKMKEKFRNNLTIDQNNFLDNLSKLYSNLIQAELDKNITEIIHLMRDNNIFNLSQLDDEIKNSFFNATKNNENNEYLSENNLINIKINSITIQNILENIVLLQNQLDDYIGNQYSCFNLRKIRNFFKNYLFCSIEQFHCELYDFFGEGNFEEKKLITHDNKEIEYIIIKSHENISNSNNNFNNNEKNLMIICGPNGVPFQMFSKNIKLDKYLNRNTDVLCWNYRGYGFSKGKPSFNNIRSDILEIFEEVKKEQKYQKIGVQGISIGGIPCCYLASKKPQEIDLLISDRNFGKMDYIAKGLPFGRVLYCLYEILWFQNSDNVENYLNSKCYKMVLNDPKDRIVIEVGSLKTMTAHEMCKSYLIKNLNQENENVININNSNNININKSNALQTLKEKISIYNINNKNIVRCGKNGVLDILLNKIEDKKNLFYLLREISYALKDENLIANNAKILYKINPLRIIKNLISGKNNRKNYSNLKEEENNNSNPSTFISLNLQECFENFQSTGDNFSTIISLRTDFQKNNFINNFFNNMFIWGVKEKTDGYGGKFYSTDKIYKNFNNFVGSIENFINSKELTNSNNSNNTTNEKMKILSDTEKLLKILLKMKESLKKIGLINEKGEIVNIINDNNNEKNPAYEKTLIKLGRGKLVSLNCGHNGGLSMEENRVFFKFLEESKFFVKKNGNNLSNNNEDNKIIKERFDEIITSQNMDEINNINSSTSPEENN